MMKNLGGKLVLEWTENEDTLGVSIRSTSGSYFFSASLSEEQPSAQIFVRKNQVQIQGIIYANFEERELKVMDFEWEVDEVDMGMIQGMVGSW